MPSVIRPSVWTPSCRTALSLRAERPVRQSLDGGILFVHIARQDVHRPPFWQTEQPGRGGTGLRCPHPDHAGDGRLGRDPKRMHDTNAVGRGVHGTGGGGGGPAAQRADASRSVGPEGSRGRGPALRERAGGQRHHPRRHGHADHPGCPDARPVPAHRGARPRHPRAADADGRERRRGGRPRHGPRRSGHGPVGSPTPRGSEGDLVRTGDGIAAVGRPRRRPPHDAGRGDDRSLRRHGSAGPDAYRQVGHRRGEEAAIFIITDLLHWLRAHGRDADDVLDRAQTRFEGEVLELP